MVEKRLWARQAARVVATMLAAGLLAGCLELDMKEAVEVDGSIVSGEFSYRFAIPEDLEEIDPEGETGLDECVLPSAGDTVPAGADPVTRELSELANLLRLRKTLDAREGDILHCAWSFRIDLADWVVDPASPVFAHVRYTEAPRRGWWVDLLPRAQLLDEEFPEWLVDEMLGSVRMTSTVSGPGVIGEGFAQHGDGSWRWSGTLAEMLQARPRYWIPG